MWTMRRKKNAYLEPKKKHTETFYNVKWIFKKEILIFINSQTDLKKVLLKKLIAKTAFYKTLKRSLLERNKKRNMMTQKQNLLVTL